MDIKELQDASFKTKRNILSGVEEVDYEKPHNFKINCDFLKYNLYQESPRAIFCI